MLAVDKGVLQAKEMVVVVLVVFAIELWGSKVSASQENQIAVSCW